MSIELRRCDEGVAEVVMSRPQKRNAFTLEMYGQFGRVFDELQADDSVRCVVVTGAGGAFCAGSDIGGFDGNRSEREVARQYARYTIEMTDKLKNLRHPTVAAIDGVCVGGGLEIACMCDLRLASARARFGIPVNRVGLTLDHDELADLAAVVGYAVALEIVLEGRIFDAAEACAKGVVSRVVADEQLAEEVQRAALAIARGAPLVNRLHKKFVRQLRDGTPLTPEMRDEAYVCFDSEDYRIGRAAFAGKQRPHFVGR